MAFPVSPGDGDTYTNALGVQYEFDSAEDKWFIISGESLVEDDDYSAGWSADTTHSPSQRVVYNELNDNRYTQTEVDALIAATLQMATGTYTGNTTNGRSFSGLGFTPMAMIITMPNRSDYLFKDDQMGTWFSYHSTQQWLEDLTIRLDADGFSIDNANPGNRPNESAQTYTWTAWGYP